MSQATHSQPTSQTEFAELKKISERAATLCTRHDRTAESGAGDMLRACLAQKERHNPKLCDKMLRIVYKELDQVYGQ